MKQKIYQIDAFTETIFGGNPAAVCPLEKWLADDILQKIAMENNLAETAYYVKKDNTYEIRWFTPTVEVDLCGHATLAAAYVLFTYEGHTSDNVEFHSPRSGKLTVTKNKELLTLNFPSDSLQKITVSEEMKKGFDQQPVEVFKGKTDYMFVFNDETQIQKLKPNFQELSKWDVRGVIATAKGEKSDFVSRFFAPQSGIDEDPATGSAHTTLTPYWADRLGKNELSAIQLSARKGYLSCKFLKDRVEISGKAKLYLIGEIYLK
ncbi:MAG TPA: PhzF family phenazine biosynthesis protein [Bacteroidia bacterium]|jgi:PhzF family phenazine biosynthesis protein|nr:PhzF family phenazine biosynthesis protein [Bacteroidia bacterium]